MTDNDDQAHPMHDTQEKLFTLQTILLMAFCLFLNIAGAALPPLLGIPLFLDTAGTVLAAVLGGGLPGITVGFLTTAIHAIDNGILLYYGILHLIIAVAAGFLALRYRFNRVGPALCSLLLFAAIGGIGGALISTLVYGTPLGNGISAPMATFCRQMLHFSGTTAKIAGDILLEICDKGLVIVFCILLIRLMPEKTLREFPLGHRVIDVRPEDSDQDILDISMSLQQKLFRMLVLTAFLIGGMAMFSGTREYQKCMLDGYGGIANMAANIVNAHVDAEQIEQHLITGTETQAYHTDKATLEHIRKAIPAIRHLYLCKLLSDRCTIIIDLNIPGHPQTTSGENIHLAEAFRPHLPALLQGEAVPPVILQEGQDKYLSILRPLFTKDGRCAAHVGVDIPMKTVHSSTAGFGIRMGALLFGIIIVIAYMAMYATQKALVHPINMLAESTRFFDSHDDSRRAKGLTHLHSLGIHTRDEVESLYQSIVSMAENLIHSITVIRQQNREVMLKNERISKMQDNIIMSFANMVEYRDDITGNHIRNTAAYVKALALALKEHGVFTDKLDDSYIATLVRSAPLHDIGKIKIPDAVLNKPGRLTPEEYDIMKQHTIHGCEILKDALAGIEDDGYLAEAMDVAKHHHERWDGKGYPLGLSGEAIPLGARLMAVADVFDALIAKRQYKDPIPFDKAMAIIAEGAGSQFDPSVAGMFVQIADKIRAITRLEPTACKQSICRR